MKPIFITLCFLICSQLCGAQTDSIHVDTTRIIRGHRNVSLAILAGYNYYGRSGIELGITKKIVGSYVHPFSGGFDASLETFRNKNWFIGPKIGFWSAGGAGFGMHFIYYTDFHQSSLQFRPAFGIGLDRFFFFYGRNMRITNTSFNVISKNMFGLNFFFDVKKYPPKKWIVHYH